MSERLEHNKDVDNILRSKLSGESPSRFEPPMEVWNHIEEAIQEDRRKSLFPLLFFVGFLALLSVSFYFLSETTENGKTNLQPSPVDVTTSESNSITQLVSTNHILVTTDQASPIMNDQVSSKGQAANQIINSDERDVIAVVKEPRKTISSSYSNIDGPEEASVPFPEDAIRNQEFLLNRKREELDLHSKETESSKLIILSSIESLKTKKLQTNSSFNFSIPAVDHRDRHRNRKEKKSFAVELSVQAGTMNSSTNYTYSENGSAQRFQVLGNDVRSFQLKLHFPILKKTNFVFNIGYNEVHFVGDYNLEARGIQLVGSNASSKQYTTEIPSYAGNISASFLLSKVGEGIVDSDVIPINLSLNHGVQFYNFGLGLSHEWYKTNKFSLESKLLVGIVNRKSTIETPSGSVDSSSSEYSTDSFDLSVRGNEASLSEVMPYMNFESNVYYQISKKFDVGIGVSISQLFNATHNNPNFDIDLRTYSGQVTLRYRL